MISVEGLTKYYGEVLAVDNLSFKIEKGQILGLLGPNGAGKSTTIRILCGYLTATSGDITIKGVAVKDAPLEVKKMIGYLPESAPLYGDMMVYDYLAYVAEIREIPKEEIPNRIRELAKICSLATVMHKNINELSKGFKQRVGLAHAMMSSPEILVLDEPTSGLDPNQIVEIRELIREIGKQKTVILSSHILSEVEATCDRVVIINQGKIVADGTPQDIKKNYSGEKFLVVELKNADAGAVNKIFSALPGVAGVEKRDAAAGGSAFAVKASGNADVSHVIFEAIKNNNWELVSFRQEERSLENIFRELTKSK